MRSDFLTTGPVVPQFEQAIATYCGAEYAIAANSATSALHIACMALEVGPGDYVWTSPNSFVASANCALYCGASIDFVDICIDSLNIDVICLADKLAEAKKTGRLPKVLIVVHFAGVPCNMPEISSLAKKYGVRIIEDASHALGASVAGTKIGSCDYSDITIFSFHPVKIITSGEGGIATTADRDLAKRMERLRSHGVVRDVDQMTVAEPEVWYYEQLELGFNYRMTDIHAALGLSQMARLDMYNASRRDLVRRYDEHLKKLPIRIQKRDIKTSSHHLYPVQFSSAAMRETVFYHLRQKEILVNVHYIPIHRHPFYQSLGFKENDFPVAEEYYSKAMSLPLFPSMTEAQQNAVITQLQDILL